MTEQSTREVPPQVHDFRAGLGRKEFHWFWVILLSVFLGKLSIIYTVLLGVI